MNNLCFSNCQKLPNRLCGVFRDGVVYLYPRKLKCVRRALKRDLRAFFSGEHFYMVLSLSRGQKFSYFKVLKLIIIILIIYFKLLNFKALNLCKTESPQSLGSQGFQGFLCNFFLGFSLYYTN